MKSALQEISQIDRIEENTEAPKDIAKLKVISKENADIREQVFYALAEAKLPILEMTHAEKSLEDIFLELTEDVAPTQPEKHKLFSKEKAGSRRNCNYKGGGIICWPFIREN